MKSHNIFIVFLIVLLNNPFILSLSAQTRTKSNISGRVIDVITNKPINNVNGIWAKNRIADILPIDYEPENNGK